MDLRIVKTHESLQQALLILLKEKPLEEITVSELCRMAKINRGTFYLHYKNIHGVFERYFEEIVEDLKRSILAPYHKMDQRLEELEADMIQIFHHVKKYETFYCIVFDEQIPMKYYYMLFHVLRTFLTEIAFPIHPPERESASAFHISYQTNAIMGILLEWHQEKYGTSPSKLNEYLMKFISIESKTSRRGK